LDFFSGSPEVFDTGIFMVRTAATYAVAGWLGTALLLASAGSAGGAQDARNQLRAAAESTIKASALPDPGRHTYQLIRQGGPFPFDKDATVFANRERLLPPRQRGYYHEYTVKTPGTPGRGARRIICGGPQPTRPDACWYTNDHYLSFRKIVP
jgi:ribonuclease T1